MNFIERDGYFYEKNTILCEKDVILPTTDMICLDISFDYDYSNIFSTCDKYTFNKIDTNIIFLSLLSIDYKNIFPRGKRCFRYKVTK